MGKGRVEIHEKINLAIIFCLDSLRKIMGKGRVEIHKK